MTENLRLQSQSKVALLVTISFNKHFRSNVVIDVGKTKVVRFQFFVEKYMYFLPRVSEVQYVRLCRLQRVGTSTEVAVRREMIDMDESINKLNSVCS